MYSGEGLDAGGQSALGVDTDLIVNPEGPSGIEGAPADGTPAGTPLGSLGPKDTPEGVREPKTKYMDS